LSLPVRSTTSWREEIEKYLLDVSRYLHLNPVRGAVLGQGTPARVPLEQLPGVRPGGENEIVFGQ
jgi:hypothetical protein